MSGKPHQSGHQGGHQGGRSPGGRSPGGRSPGGRSPGEVLRAARQADSRLKRGRVLAALEELKAGGEPITFPAVRQAAGVSKWLVYAPGVREHIEAAIAGQAKKTRRASAAGGTGGGAAGITASAASLACDLELARDQLRQLRAERDKLKAAVQRGLGTALESVGTAEMTARVSELLAQVERLAAERDTALAEKTRLQAALDESADNLTAARQALKQMMKDANRGRAGDGKDSANTNARI
ncbi:DUF6262 family protein [Nonomuraea sp. NPDC050202]|uniref:DUF6262 family protein n=1 Tax=Nonomuraea sp. NPDC050202 TaxID=3155035 RepID=UPI0033C9CDDA